MVEIKKVTLEPLIRKITFEPIELKIIKYYNYYTMGLKEDPIEKLCQELLKEFWDDNEVRNIEEVFNIYNRNSFINNIVQFLNKLDTLIINKIDSVRNIKNILFSHEDENSYYFKVIPIKVMT